MQSLTVRQTANMVGVSERNLYHASRVKRDAPDLYERIVAGDLTIGAAVTMLRERLTGDGLTDAQRGRAAESDILATRLVEVLDEWLTEERAQRLIDLWIKYGDG